MQINATNNEVDKVEKTIVTIFKDFYTGKDINPELYSKNSNQFEQLPYFLALTLSENKVIQDSLVEGILSVYNFSIPEYADLEKAKIQYEKNLAFKDFLINFKATYLQMNKDFYDNLSSLELTKAEYRNYKDNFLKNVKSIEKEYEKHAFKQTEITLAAAEKLEELLELRLNAKGKTELTAEDKIIFHDDDEQQKFNKLANEFDSAVLEVEKMLLEADQLFVKH